MRTTLVVMLIAEAGSIMTVQMDVFFLMLIILAYITAPVMLFWGWVRWTIHRPRTWTFPATLSFAVAADHECETS